MTRQVLTEATQTTATPVEGKPGRFLVQLIDVGWGSSGYYSAEVLEAAAKNRVFAKGTHMYLDHPTESEKFERPERSLRDLASVLSEDAYYDASLRSLVGEAQVFGRYREDLDQMKESIGVSIRAAAEVTEGGEAEGRRGRIIDALVEGLSADYVTHAGRGGKILRVLESARDTVEEARNIGQWIESRIHRDFTVLADDMAGDGRLTRDERIGLSSAIGDALAAFVANLEAGQPQLYQRDIWSDPADTTAVESAAARRAVAHGVDEATANDIRDALDQVLREEYGGEKTYVWVRDFDDSTVWFQVEDGTDSGLYAQTYSSGADGAVALTGERTEVRQVTTYVPVSPAGQSTTQESKEDTMATTQIEESELARLREDAGRVTTLESERDAAVQRAETAEGRAEAAESRLADHDRDAVVARIIGEAAEAASVQLNEFETAGMAGRRVLAEDGTVDEDATRTAIDTAIASLAEAAGAGRVRGMGGKVPTNEAEPVSEADLDALGDAAFGPITQEA